jgi:hypothetical protein
LDLSSGGAWSFDLPPPSAKIINYGQINITGGGSAFLIADDIENNGTISAPNGKIGLYAGQTVLVSTSPNGLGLSAQVTLPKGSVDNEGHLIADGGSIAAQAQTINQNGMIQANSVQNVNGTIELVASDAVNLNANSAISAQGDSMGASSGGAVTVKSDNAFSDQAGSTINISGGAQGGNGGQVEISAPQMSTINSVINGQAVDGFISGELTVDPLNIQLVSSGGNGTAGEYSSGTVNSSDPPTAGTLQLNVNSFNSSTLSQINLQAQNNIELDTTWTLAAQTVPATLSLTAGNNITLNGSIKAGNNWSVNLTAGTQVSSESDVTSGNDGIYLNGTFIQTQNGNINLSAANEVIINDGGGSTDSAGIRTEGDGNITVNATYGDVNAGINPNGYNYLNVDPTLDTTSSIKLGGISTAAGGNVSITAGGDVISCYTSAIQTLNQLQDGGSGAFGSQPGNVTIVAGGNVYGNYVLANGVGSITALNGNIGDPDSNETLENIFSLNLISGSWTVNAPNGSISLQEVRNPNGDFNPNYQFAFNYAPDASVTLNAGDAVVIWGDPNNGNVPRDSISPVPVVLPPILNVSAGKDGFTLDSSITLFQSPDANLNITTTDGGDFNGNNFTLYMSDSASSLWDASANTMLLGDSDIVTTPYELSNPNYGPAIITISGNLENVNIYTVKETQLTVDGNMINAGFAAQNLHPTDVTSVTVIGQIYYSPLYTFETLGGALQPGIPSLDEPLGNTYLSQPLDEFFYLLVNPADVTVVTTASGTTYETILTAPSGTTYKALNNPAFFPNLFLNRNTDGTLNSSALGNLGYNPANNTLSYKGPMSTATENYLESGSFYVVQLDANGNPVLDGSGHLILDEVSLADSSVISTLYNNSQHTTTTPSYGLQIGGPGQFNITAGAISLGESDGIESWGIYGPQADATEIDFNSLTAVTPPGSGASINVTTLDTSGTDPFTGDPLASLDMVSSRIASWYGGDVTVNCGGAMNLGTQEILQGQNDYAYGIFTIDMNPGPTGHGNVTVEALDDVNIQGSRIAAFNGGNVSVTSDEGSVNVGSGGNTFSDVEMVYENPANPQSSGNSLYRVYGSGIVAESLPGSELALGQPKGATPQPPLPGNITVTAHKDITADTAAILQIALDGSTTGGPTVILKAGNDIDLGNSGLIGGTVNATAGGNISGLIISRQDSDINAAANFSGIVLSGGTANLNAGSASGEVIGISGLNSTVGGSSSLSLVSANLSAPGASGSTFATATASANDQAAAANNNEATTQVADTATSDDEKNKKKKPVIKHVGRVTVILSTAVPR